MNWIKLLLRNVFSPLNIPSFIVVSSFLLPQHIRILIIHFFKSLLKIFRIKKKSISLAALTRHRIKKILLNFQIWMFLFILILFMTYYCYYWWWSCCCRYYYIYSPFFCFAAQDSLLCNQWPFIAAITESNKKSSKATSEEEREREKSHRCKFHCRTMAISHIIMYIEGGFRVCIVQVTNF